MADPQSNVAMSVWEKYSELQEETESCRENRNSKEALILTLTSELEQLQRTKDSDKQSILNFKESIESLKVELGRSQSKDGGTDSVKINGCLMERLEKASQEHSAASLLLDTTKQTQEAWKTWKTEALVSARESSQAFQAEIRSLQLQAISLGLTRDVTLAAVQSGKFAGIIVPDDLDTEMSENPMNLVSDDGNENDPSTWVVPAEDQELLDAIKKYKAALEKTNKTRQCLSLSNDHIVHLDEKSSERQSKLEKLQAQLRRIEDCCSDLASQIQQLELLSAEDQALAETYRAKIAERNKPKSTKRSIPKTKTPVKVASLIPPEPTTTSSSAQYHNPYRRSNKRSRFSKFGCSVEMAGSSYASSHPDCGGADDDGELEFN